MNLPNHIKSAIATDIISRMCIPMFYKVRQNYVNVVDLLLCGNVEIIVRDTLRYSVQGAITQKQRRKSVKAALKALRK